MHPDLRGRRSGVITGSLVVPLLCAGLISCTRPLGIWEQQTTLVEGPCGEPSGLDPDAPWPMDGRCPSRASFIEVRGPSAPQVLWTVAAGDSYSGEAVVDADEVVYARMPDLEGRSALHAIDRSGSVAWKTLLYGLPVPGRSAAVVAMGGTGRLYVRTRTALLALGDEAQ